MNTLQAIRIDREVSWRRVETTTATLVVAATLLVCSASSAAVALGDPELVAAVAAIGVAVLLLGMGILVVAGALDDTSPGWQSVPGAPIVRLRRPFGGYEP